MIKLSFPKLSEDRYLFWHDLCIGPYDLTGIYSGETVSFNSTLRFLEQSRGIFGDNNVEHQHITGDFQYHPLVNGCVPAYTATHPRRISVPIWNQYNQAVMARAMCGLATIKGSTRYYTTDFRYTKQRATFRDPETGQWSIWEIEAANAYASASAVYRYDLTRVEVLSQSSGMSYVHFRRRQYSSVYGGPFALRDYTKQVSFEDIKSICEGRTPVSDSNTKDIGYLYRIRIPAWGMNVSSAKEQIEALVGTIFGGEYPIKDYPYGDLAMRAVHQLDANHTNMIAFIRDLRHPTKLIPKLRNMRNLKTWANGYLTVKYGILPTVDDVQRIVRAFKDRVPYLDKNGFRTYAAGESSTLIVGEMSYKLEQYLKIALENEDDEFKLLIERLENMGVWPSMENIWDLIPYSFVVDWLIDVGSFLKRVDVNLRLSRLKIRYVTMSRKTTSSGVSQAETLQTPFIGTIDWVHYHRWVSDQCPRPTLSLSPPTQPFNHWLEAGALLIQRTR